MCIRLTLHSNHKRSACNPRGFEELVLVKFGYLLTAVETISKHCHKRSSVRG